MRPVEFTRMKITDYLDQEARSLKSTAKKIRNFRVFDFNFIPEEPLMREEAKPIIDACLRYRTTGIPNHLFIFGSRGSGKTLMVRHIGNLLATRDGTTVLYANCRQHNTSFKILAHLLSVRPRGTSLDELWQRFRQRYPSPVILILDEVDLISEKDVNREILYLISRDSAPYMAIMLSNHPQFLSTLDPSVRSSLQPEFVHFRNYYAPQIQEILAERARQGLHQAPEQVLALIAALTVQRTNADVRIAIKTLYYWALSEDPPEVRTLFERATRDLTTEVLADLNDRNLLILHAVLDTPEPLVKAVYERYRELSQLLQLEPFSYVYFYSNLSYLQSIGLILLLSTKMGRTYTNRIQLLFQPELLEDIFANRFR
jgi:Cdc6-like AAA superfamily ATPase